MTRARPVRKLFVLDPDDIEGFIAIIKMLTSDWAGLHSIFALNDSSFNTENTRCLIERYDPDLIVNRSRLKNEELSRVFRTRALTPDDLNMVGSMVIPVLELMDMRASYRRLSILDLLQPGDEIVVNYADNPTPENLMRILHCGIAKRESFEQLSRTVLRDLRLREMVDVRESFDVARNQNATPLNLTIDFFARYTSGSVYSKNFNESGYFEREPAVVIGDTTDLRSMVYFWNTRAAYPTVQLVWVPRSEVERCKEQLRTIRHYCIFSTRDNVRGALREIRPDIVEIDTSTFSFHAGWQHWTSLTNYQQVPVLDGKVTISHPRDKLFFSNEWVSAVIDVWGPDELYLPKSVKLGQLCVREEAGRSLSRISRSGFSFHFSAFGRGTGGVDVSVGLPSFEESMKVFFAEHGFAISRSEKSPIAESAIALVGGLEGIRVIRDRSAFELLVKLTPKRIERIVKELVSAIPMKTSEESILESIERSMDRIQTLSYAKVVEIEQMMSLLSVPEGGKAQFLSIVQMLYDSGFLLRGKSCQCSECRGLVWFTLDEVRNQNVCPHCGASIRLPVAKGEFVLADSYRLNELVVRAVDQGQLPVLLVARFMDEQGFYGRKQLYNANICNGDRSVVTDIDVLVQLGSLIGLVEVKADRGFESEQVKQLVAIAEAVGADFLGFATLKTRESEEVANLVSLLRDLSIERPAFVLASEALFATHATQIIGHFQLIPGGNRFPKGPIVL